MENACAETVPGSRAVPVVRLRLATLDTIQGVPVRNPEGEEIGSIRTYVIDLTSGGIIYAVLAYGGVLGLGEKFFAIPWEALIPEPRRGVFYVNIPKEKLESLPGFDRDAWPVAGDWTLIEPTPSPPTPKAAYPSVPPQVALEEETCWEAVRPITPIEPIEPVEPIEVPRAPVPCETVTVLVIEPCATTEQLQEIPGRAEDTEKLQQYLEGVDYPVDRQELINKAKEHGAPPAALEVLQRFEEREYGSALDVQEELGRIH